MKYYEITFRINPNSQDSKDILAAIAGDTGFESFIDCEQGITGYVRTCNFDKTSLDAGIENFPVPDTSITYEVHETEDKNWNEEWEKDGFAPIIIDNRCAIYDAKRGFDDNLFPITIAIDAQQAFGTGTHETTRMIVSALLETDLKGKRVLDCGCGTGILGIVASKTGAKEVVGYDIDDWSVKNTIHNAELNNVAIEVLEGDKSVLSHVNGVFDVILANINRNILLCDMPVFAELMNNPCKLVISGFYDTDADILTGKAQGLGMKKTKETNINGWCCLVFEK